MEFKTRISKIENNDVTIRGKKLSDLIKGNKFTDVIFLQISGREPDNKESVIFEKILISIIDHGVGTTSSLTSRFTASGGNSINVAVGAGVLSIGDYHGGAIEKAMQQFNGWRGNENASQLIKSKVENKEVIYGFGHRIYKKGDPRVKVILEEIERIGYQSNYLKFKSMVEESFEDVKGKKIHINIDGLIAILLCDFGFDPLLGKGIFVIGRISGLVSQSYEELKFEKPVRRLSEDKITYLSDNLGGGE